MSNLLPYVEKGNKTKPVIVFLAGFPDNETSGWGEVPQDLEKNFRVILLCMPDYGKGNKVFKPWGYSFDEILQMMHATLQSLKVTDSKFYLVAHDWGAFLGLRYENQHPELIEKLVLLDVGLLNPKNAPVKHILIVLLYQFWFAFAYVLSQTISVTLGNLVFKLFTWKPIAETLGPCPHEKESPIPMSELVVNKCYPYYHFWRCQLTLSLKEPKYPSCPLLFMVSSTF